MRDITLQLGFLLSFFKADYMPFLVPMTVFMKYVVTIYAITIKKLQ